MRGFGSALRGIDGRPQGRPGSSAERASDSPPPLNPRGLGGDAPEGSRGTLGIGSSTPLWPRIPPSTSGQPERQERTAKATRAVKILLMIARY
jgi:hypothetical protein